MKFQKSDIVIERLAVMIVMDIRRRNAQGLSTWASVFTSEIVITHPHVDCVAGPHDAGNERLFIFLSVFQFVSRARARACVIVWEIVSVAHATDDIYSLRDTMRCSEDPLRPYQCASA